MADSNEPASLEGLTKELEEKERELESLRRELEASRARADLNDASVAELRSSEELTRRLIEAMPGGVVHVAVTGAIQTANPEALRVLGLSYDEISKRYTTDFETQTIYEDGRPCPVEDYPVSRALITGETQPARTIGVRRPDGEISWAIFTAVPITGDDGATQGAVVTFLDITDRLALEEHLREAQKMEAIGRLAGGIAHDFNNLLTVVLANASELQQSLVPNDPRETDVEQVLQATRAASKLTSQLLAFARKQVISPTVLGLNHLVRDTVTLLERVVGGGIEIHLQTASDLWPVFVDRNQFEQVIINLVLNARDAVPDGGDIWIETENADLEGEQEVILRVRDSGEGVPDAEIEHVFEPFYTTKETGHGTGLGLATCYGIATQAGGTIDARSNPGEGATFEVRLPRAPADVIEQVEAAPSQAATATGSGTILVVEDEPPVRRIVERILARQGYRVLAAGSGESALALLDADTELDLVLADVMMPNMSGPEVVEQIRAQFPNVAVLYMSGYPDDALTRHGLIDGPTHLLRKPFEPEALASRLRELLAERASAAITPLG